MSMFSPTRPHCAELVIKSPCPSVCLRHRETPTSGGRVDLWTSDLLNVSNITNSVGVKFSGLA